MARKANKKPQVIFLDVADTAALAQDVSDGKIPIGTIIIVNDTSEVLIVAKRNGLPTVVEMATQDLILSSGADLSLDLFKFCKLDNTGSVVRCSAAGEPALGIIQNTPLAAVGSTVIVRTFGSSNVLIGAAPLTAGMFIATDANGTAQQASPAAVAGADCNGSFCMGDLRVSGNAATIKECILIPRGLIPTNFV